MAVIKVQTVEEYDTALKDNVDKLIVIDFTASWCGPCRAIAPKFEAMAKEFSEKAVFLKVDVDELDEIAEKEKVQAMPTFKFYKNGKEVMTKLVGANEASLRSKIQDYKSK